MRKKKGLVRNVMMSVAVAGLVLTGSGVTVFADDAGRTVEEAEARVAEAKEAVAAAQDALSEAQSALEEAAEKYEAGAFAFFEDIGATSALDALNNAKYRSYTEKGNEKDATSFSNMLASLDFIRECNDLRKGEGCSELMVSHYLMAVAMSDANASAYILDHTQQFGVGENLSWGYQDPFDGWYTEEKAIYDTGDHSSSTTGHYQNIVNNTYGVTGFAMNQYGSYRVTHGQVFYFSSADDDAMSVDEYEQELTVYIASLDQDALTEKVSEAEAALADAQEEQRAAEEELAALADASRTADETSESGESTPEPGEESGTDETTPEPGEESGTDESTPEPGEGSGTDESTPEPGEETGTDDGTPEPGEETGTDETTPEPEETNETDVSTPEPENPNYGFSVSQLFSTDTFKVDHAYSTHDDGSNTFQIYFYTDGDEDWIDENVTFTVEDVTSEGTIRVMESAGIPYVEPQVTISSADEALLDAKRYNYVLYVTLPIGEDGPILGSYGNTITATSGKEITVEAGQSTRCVKVTAYKDGEVIDYVYSRTSKATDGGYSAADRKLYERTCASIEEQIWSAGMTNLEKLTAFADYISSVSHYPNSDTTNAEYNPEWAEMWGEDGSTDYKLIWWNFADQYVDWTMALQGGQSTCLAANMLYDIALNDLGLTDISIEDEDAGEGVYVGIGKNSSNPTNGAHYSLVYQAADGTRTFVDAQGMSYSASSAYVTCSAHGCRDNVIPISSYGVTGSDNSDEIQEEVQDSVVVEIVEEQQEETDPSTEETSVTDASAEDSSTADSTTERVMETESATAETSVTDSTEEEPNAEGSADYESSVIEITTDESSDEKEDDGDALLFTGDEKNVALDGKEGEDTTKAPEGLVRLLSDDSTNGDAAGATGGNGSETETSDGSESTTDRPKTGDTDALVWYLLLAVGGAGAAVAAATFRRKQKKAR